HVASSTSSHSVSSCGCTSLFSFSTVSVSYMLERTLLDGTSLFPCGSRLTMSLVSEITTSPPSPPSPPPAASSPLPSPDSAESPSDSISLSSVQAARSNDKIKTMLSMRSSFKFFIFFPPNNFELNNIYLITLLIAEARKRFKENFQTFYNYANRNKKKLFPRFFWREGYSLFPNFQFSLK